MPLNLRSRVVKTSAPQARQKAEGSARSSEKRATTSKYFTRLDTEDHPRTIPQPPGLTFTLQPATYGLIQERICDSLYALVVQAILWNQTRGQMARPVLFELLATYPSPHELSKTSLEDLTAMLQPIGLHRIRAARLIALAEAWLAAPPCKERRYRRLHYPSRGCGTDVKPSEVLGPDDEREGWEIAHLPGMGAYALDSYRIFYRDRLREVENGEGVEAEWKRVVPLDKELKPYLQWKREQELVNGQVEQKDHTVRSIDT
jgi:methyl-CpG-binding domain protein 4